MSLGYKLGDLFILYLRCVDAHGTASIPRRGGESTCAKRDTYCNIAVSTVYHNETGPRVRVRVMGVRSRFYSQMVVELYHVGRRGI